MESERKDIDLIARRMAELRAEHGKSQEECARALGIRQNAYSYLERGETRPRRRDLVTLAVLYGMDPEDAFPMLATVEAA